MFKILTERMGTDENKFVRKILVESESDLANIPTNTAPSSVAHTAGMDSVWELGLDGTWHEINVGSGGGVGGLDYIIGSDNGLPYVQDA